MSEIRNRKSETESPTSDLRLPPSVFLLHGVTGSGKTEIYLQALAHALEQGQGAIVLVPEISLTPQTVERFKARFSSGKLQTLVAVLHSHLSAGERHDEWHKIRQGRARIVIGARSAIFAPVEPLGLIIVDEEHEHTYKQEEAPRYHARDVAIMRGQMENAVVVLGSATPSLESYYNCKQGKYTLLELPERVDDQKMPHVRVVDMRQAARKEKGTPIFSPQLKEAITQRLERGEQTILFLNRRGYSTSLQCPKCGLRCEMPELQPRAHVPSHRTKAFLPHLRSRREKVPSVCPNPKCKNPAIRFAGTGTQKVEETLAKLFPNARVRRMDADTMKRKDDYRKTLGDFRAGKIDILVGTQMIAKGLHFPNVTLVGIIYADLALHQPDFRAGERTFQLLTQVAGRAGRGDVEGEVFVQAFAPFHPAIQYARRHDFTGFYEQEIEFREQLKYPPVSRVALAHTQRPQRGQGEIFRRTFETRIGKAVCICRSQKLGRAVLCPPTVRQAQRRRAWSDAPYGIPRLNHRRSGAGAVAARGNFLSLPNHAAHARHEQIEPDAGENHRDTHVAGRRDPGRGHRSGKFRVRQLCAQFLNSPLPQIEMIQRDDDERSGRFFRRRRVLGFPPPAPAASPNPRRGRIPRRASTGSFQSARCKVVLLKMAGFDQMCPSRRAFSPS